MQSTKTVSGDHLQVYYSVPPFGCKWEIINFAYIHISGHGEERILGMKTALSAHSGDKSNYPPSPEWLNRRNFEKE